MSQPELKLASQPIYLTKQHCCEPIALYEATSLTRLTGPKPKLTYMSAPCTKSIHTHHSPLLYAAL